MALIDNATLWTKTENATSITTPEIGPSGSIIGTPTYPAAKFNNGVLAAATSNNVSYSQATIFTDYSVWAIDMWLKPTLSKVGWTTTQWIYHSRGGSDHGFTVGITSSGDVVVYKQDAGGVTLMYTATTPAFSAGDLIHLLIVFDKNAGFDGAKTSALYWNETQIASGTTAFNIASPRANLSLLNADSGTNQACIHVTIDNMKIYKEAQVSSAGLLEILENKNNEGWPVSLVAPILIEPDLEDARKIIVNGVDLIAKGKVVEIPNLEYMRSFENDRLFINETRIKCKNEDGYFNADNPNSFFSTFINSKKEFKRWDKFGNLVFDGYLVAKPLIDENTLQAELLGRGKYHTSRYDRIVYSGGVENGAEAFENIMIQLELEDLIDLPSLNKSKGVLDLNSVQIQVTTDADSELNFLDLIEKIAKYSCADIYDYKGKVHFQVWQEVDTRLISKSIDLNGEGIKGKPVINPIEGEKYLVNDYNIRYNGDGGVAATDGANDDIGSLSRDNYDTHSLQDVESTTPIEFQNLASAVWVGNQHIKRSHVSLLIRPEPRQKLTYIIDDEILNNMDLTTIAKMNYDPQAWVNKPFEVHRILFDDNDNAVEIEGWELDQES